MSWRNLLGNLLMKAGDALPTPTEPPAADPLNYVLAQQLASRGLHNPAREPAELQRRALAAFPATPAAALTRIMQQLAAAHELAFDLASQVNNQQLAQSEANERLAQAFPQLNPANRQSLLLQNLVDTR